MDSVTAALCQVEMAPQQPKWSHQRNATACYVAIKHNYIILTFE